MPTIEVKEDGCCWLDGEPVGPADRCEIKPSPLTVARFDETVSWRQLIPQRVTWQLWCGGSLVREFEHSDTTIVFDSVGEHQPRETETDNG